MFETINGGSIPAPIRNNPANRPCTSGKPFFVVRLVLSDPGRYVGHHFFGNVAGVGILTWR